ncbi:Ribosomal RNA-processing protein 7 [Corchorus capsularis]|uniref:Ribosomal RNA-processing protein 7 n=1 Tax=Corchorus capsularis TaxID=210143 RepID=A0A1R3J125_COCAP|nr:Ribosomal RNA-processing protein 7 [Corchorus capsularis]
MKKNRSRDKVDNIVETKEEKKKEKSNKKKRKAEEKNSTTIGTVGNENEGNFQKQDEWITDYQQSRPGLKILQQRIDEFIVAHEEELEQERKEREARLTEGGWTLVEHHKGRKKTTEAESGTTVGSVSQTAVEGKLAKQKSKEVSDFYRFQKRQAQRNELMMLQSKFEQEKKHIQQLKAARKFRPY